MAVSTENRVFCRRFRGIGRGGNAVIFRAKDMHRASPQDTRGDFLAIKMLRPELRSDPSALMRLKREFRQLQSLSHPGIVRVFDLDCDHGAWFISMQFVAGQTVKAWMQTPHDHAEALGIIGACCNALEYAHCMRRHGEPGFPDPSNPGGFSTRALAQLDTAV